MPIETKFRSFVEKEKTAAAYRNYLEAREHVFSMLDNAQAAGDSANPSLYWKHELGGFEYMLDVSPLVIQKLRHHCYHISGLHDYDYRPHHGHMAAMFERKLRLLQSHDRNNLGVPEHPALGGFGFPIDGELYNLDTLRYYECLLAMDKGNLLDKFRDPSAKRKIVVEIGTGWGGFAYQFKTLFSNTTYVVVDFPATILFSATYLKTVFPEAKILFLTGGSDSSPKQPITDYDFVFVPHFAWQSMNFDRKPDLVINMVSFQEMTDAQVDQYVKKAADWGVPHVYSMNRDRSRHNKELGTVSSILNKYYTTEDIRILQIQSSRLPTNMIKYYLQPAKRMSIKWLGWPKHKPHYDYRHLICRLS